MLLALLAALLVYASPGPLRAFDPQVSRIPPSGPAGSPATERNRPEDAALTAKARRIEKAVLSRCILPDGYFAYYTLRPGMWDPRKFIRAGQWPRWPTPRGLPDHFKPEDHPEFGPVYRPDVYCRFLLDRMGEYQDEPFFLYYPKALVHSPFVPTPDSADRNNKNKQPNFADMVS